MARKSGRKGIFRQMVDVSSWMDLQGLRDTSKNIGEAFRDLQSVRIPPERETFDEAMQRLNLDEDGLKRRMRQCLYTAWLYFSIGVVLFFYAFYLLIFAHTFGAVVSAILTAITLTLAYREAFWYYQMRVRKLGCSIFDFLAFISGRK